MPALPPASDLRDHMGFWLRVVSNQVSHAFAGKLAAKGVTVAEWVMMRALYGAEPMAPSQLAESMGMTRGAITKLADRLIGKALVVRRASDADARAQTLSLTGQGVALVPDLAALADRNDAEWFGHLARSDRETLERILKQLAQTGGEFVVPTV
ncbi:MarR family transcriptional regulator [Hyphomonas oceanitis]|uniref:MarR family winged helix-turn-helix transcriptional regulator n=1 Tax=Hyphomonas oceanitis TaxID=81033 RepID=UPI0030025A13